MAGGTAYSALKQVGVGEGDTVLIHAAAGGVGSAAVQIAQALGARVIGTASEANQEYLRELGAEPVTYGPGLVDRVRSVAEDAGDVTAVLDAAGTGESVAATLELLADRNRAVTTVPGKQSQDAGIAAVQQHEARIMEVASLAAEGLITFTIAHRLPLMRSNSAAPGMATARSFSCHSLPAVRADYFHHVSKIVTGTVRLCRVRRYFCSISSAAGSGITRPSR